MKVIVEDRVKWSLKVIGVLVTSLFHAIITVTWGLVAIYALFRVTNDAGIILDSNIMMATGYILDSFSELVLLFLFFNFYTKWKELSDNSGSTSK